tara:strand:+ start:1090 stop:1437 length:348 start_codon:yes stop_codon:yes gene_type:complete
MVQHIIDEKTNEFLNNIDILSKSNQLVDNDFYAINLCQKLIDLYLSRNNYSIKNTLENFSDIFNNLIEISMLKIMSGLCVDVLRLRLAKTIDNEKLKKESVKNIKKYLIIFDSLY